MKKKKLIAPIVVTVVLVLWILFWLFCVCALPDLPLAGKVVGALASIGLGGVAIFNLIERAREIGSGEEDDLDNY